MFAPLSAGRWPHVFLDPKWLLLVLVTVSGCSPSAPRSEAAGGWGGASFTAWPPPIADSSSDDAENPWLTGEALDQPDAPAASSGGGPAAPNEVPTWGSGGGAPVIPSGPSASGGMTGDPPHGATPARLVLRAYVESSGSFKGVLVEHLGGDASGDCTVELYSNGSTEVWRRLDVPAGLTSGARALLCVPEAAVSACTVGFGGSVFNGNDALVLRCDGQVQDMLGTVGIDPGKGWTGTGYDGHPVSSVDRGLWRCDDAPLPSGFSFEQWMDWDWTADATWSGPSCVRGGWGGAPNAP